MPGWLLFWLGWLAAWACWLLLMRRAKRGRDRRRGGYVRPPAYISGNQWTGTSTDGFPADFSFWTQPGGPSEGTGAQVTPIRPNKPGGPGFSIRVPDEDGGVTGLRPRGSAGSPDGKGAA